MKFSGLRIDRNDRARGGVRLESDTLTTAGQMENPIVDDITDLFAALRNSIFSYLVDVLAAVRPNDIEDITQDAFLRLHRYLGKGARDRESAAAHSHTTPPINAPPTAASPTATLQCKDATASLRIGRTMR